MTIQSQILLLLVHHDNHEQQYVDSDYIFYVFFCMYLFLLHCGSLQVCRNTWLYSFIRTRCSNTPLSQSLLGVWSLPDRKSVWTSGWPSRWRWRKATRSIGSPLYPTYLSKYVDWSNTLVSRLLKTEAKVWLQCMLGVYFVHTCYVLGLFPYFQSAPVLNPILCSHEHQLKIATHSAASTVLTSVSWLSRTVSSSLSTLSWSSVNHSPPAVSFWTNCTRLFLRVSFINLYLKYH